MNPYEKRRGMGQLQMPTTNPDQVPNDNTKVFEAMETTDKPIQASNAAVPRPTQVAFPPHLFIPQNAESIDIRKVMNIPAATSDYEILSFTAPEGAVTRFIQYGVFNDGLLAADYRFLPVIDGSRIFRYHGDPTDNYRIALGLGPDLSETAMIGCQLMLYPGQTVKWLVTNSSAVDTAMGVRMKGYLDTSQRLVPTRFG